MPHSITIKKLVLSTQCIFVSCSILRTKTDNFPQHYELIHLGRRDESCFLCGRTWMFIYEVRSENKVGMTWNFVSKNCTLIVILLRKFIAKWLSIPSVETKCWQPYIWYDNEMETFVMW